MHNVIDDWREERTWSWQKTVWNEEEESKILNATKTKHNYPSIKVSNNRIGLERKKRRRFKLFAISTHGTVRNRKQFSPI